MTGGKKRQPNNRGFANVVQNHSDNNNNSDFEVNNMNLELSTENATPFMDNNNPQNLKDQS